MPTTNEVKTVTPVVNQEKKDELVQTTVTVIKDKEIAAILYASTEKNITLAFSLQDAYENPSVYQKDALHDASIMFLKYSCQQTIQRWDSAVTKATKMQKYSAMGRPEIEKALSIHPKLKPLFDAMNKAVSIKRSLQ